MDEFELEEHELALLWEAVRAVDLLDDLAAAVQRDGPLTTEGRLTRRSWRVASSGSHWRGCLPRFGCPPVTRQRLARSAESVPAGCMALVVGRRGFGGCSETP